MRTLFTLIALSGWLAWPVLARADPEPCPPDVGWDSLCNVEPELRRAFLWLERVDGLPHFRDRISAMVRDRHVTVEWDWDDWNTDHLGAYHRKTRQIKVPIHLRENSPNRVLAGILAHELWHAHAEVRGLFQPFTARACLDDERDAFVVGLLFYANVYWISGEPGRPMHEADEFYRELMLEWEQGGATAETLQTMAREYLADKGYVFICAFVEQPW